MFLLFSTCINRSDDIVLTESVYLSSVYGFCHRWREQDNTREQQQNSVNIVKSM